MEQKLDRMIEMLRSIADEEPVTRRRLRELRDSSEYAAPFETPDPLVSVVIPTYRNVEQLRSRSLPSALAQTHANIEVIVVGDAAPDETAKVVELCGDSRVHFENLPVRGPYSADPDRAWLIAGSPPFNAGLASARGLWIAPLGDDDAFTPDHVEQLMCAAVQHRWELAYGRLRAHLDDGRELLLGEFPPRLSQFGFQGALYHAGLSQMEMNLADELFGEPNDWSLCRRMLRAGVRMGMIDAPVVDYYPSAWGRRGAPEAPDKPDPAEELARARERVADLERELAAIASSRSWRMTRPLRAVGRRLRGGT